MITVQVSGEGRMNSQNKMVYPLEIVNFPNRRAAIKHILSLGKQVTFVKRHKAPGRVYTIYLKTSKTK